MLGIFTKAIDILHLAWPAKYTTDICTVSLSVIKKHQKERPPESESAVSTA